MSGWLIFTSSQQEWGHSNKRKQLHFGEVNIPQDDELPTPATTSRPRTISTPTRSKSFIFPFDACYRSNSHVAVATDQDGLFRRKLGTVFYPNH